MKIIGKAENGYMCLLQEEEIFNILGVSGYKGKETKEFKSAAEKQGRNIYHNSDLIGLEIPVSGLFESSRILAQGIDQQYSFKQIIEYMDRLRGELDDMSNVFNIERVKNGRA